MLIIICDVLSLNILRECFSRSLSLFLLFGVIYLNVKFSFMMMTDNRPIYQDASTAKQIKHNNCCRPTTSGNERSTIFHSIRRVQLKAPSRSRGHSNGWLGLQIRMIFAVQLRGTWHGWTNQQRNWNIFLRAALLNWPYYLKSTFSYRFRWKRIALAISAMVE